jgi:hypothetical protein
MTERSPVAWGIYLLTREDEEKGRVGVLKHA